jgi:hypothetical protein
MVTPNPILWSSTFSKDQFRLQFEGQAAPTFASIAATANIRFHACFLIEGPGSAEPDSRLAQDRSRSLVVALRAWLWPNRVGCGEGQSASAAPMVFTVSKKPNAAPVTPAIADQTYTLQCSTNLHDWNILYSTNGTGTSIELYDTNAASFRQRFYRLQQQP